jgi:hypothetical protein
MNESIAEQIIVERATQVSTSACETVYTFNGYEIRLWIITGGTPCLAFHYGPFSERYPIVEKYVDDYYQICQITSTPEQKTLVNHWNRELVCYDHQMADKMATGKVQGPTPEDCFEDGWATFWNFYHSNVRQLELCNKRSEMIFDLTNGNACDGILKSKRAHDKEDHTYVHAELRLNGTGISPVTYISAAYAGRCEEKVVLFNPWWKEAQDLFNPIFDNGTQLSLGETQVTTHWPRWDKLTNEQFNSVCELLKEFKA